MGKNITLGKILFAIKAGQNYFNAIYRTDLDLSPTTITKIIKELEMMGLITTVFDKQTRRKVVILNEKRKDEIEQLINDYAESLEIKILRTFTILQKVNAERAKKLLEKLKGDSDVKRV
ncbi:MAG: MarR family winged helix-turn-helix transcriptional regulator [Archaeoglobales archaeon]|nr:MarR family winged helix-turn-helix transcriptional regulator [Archaeoglobales archaeon]